MWNPAHPASAGPLSYPHPKIKIIWECQPPWKASNLSG